MIDRKARHELLALVRAFISGQLTNFEFERNAPLSEDNIIGVVEEYLWLFYDDFKEHRFNRRGMSKTMKKELARIVLFLNSDREYEWPEIYSPLTKTDTLFKKFKLFFKPPWTPHTYRVNNFDDFNAGDLSVWPFIHRKHMMAEANKHRVGLSLKLSKV